MPEVYNWHLGRKMLYPYEERHPKWQFAFVFNINRCLACQTCSMADKSTWLFSKGQEYMWWNNVETKPYGGYPQFYDVKITQLIEQVNPGGQVWNVRVGRKHHAPYGVFEGMTIFDAGAKVGQAAIGYIPTDQEWRFVNIYEDTATSMRAIVEGIDKTGFTKEEPWRMTGSSLPEHETYFFYLQRICNHCTYPGCLAACPRKAIYKRPEDGIVLIDQNRCRGTRSAWSNVHTKSQCIGVRLGSPRSASPAIRGSRGKILSPAASRWKPGVWRPAWVRFACRTSSRSARTDCGRKIGGTPCITPSGWNRWRCRCTRNGAPSRTGITFPRGNRPWLHPADVRAGRGQCDREVLGAEPGTVSRPPALESEPTDRLPVRHHSWTESVRNPNSRSEVRDVQRHRVRV